MNRNQNLALVALTFLSLRCGSDPQNPVADAAISDSSVDSFVDARVDDARVDDAVAIDAADVFDAGRPFTCASGALLCSNFEDLGGPAVGWTQEVVQHGSNSLDTSAFTSPIHSYSSSTVVSATPAKAVLSFSDATSYSVMSAQFQVRVHQLGEPVTILQLSYVAFNVVDSVALVTDGFELYLVSGAFNQPVYPIVMDAWTQLRVDLDPGVDVTVIVDGKFTKTFTPPLDAPFIASHTYALGVEAPGKAANVVQFDDVVLNGK